MEFELFAFTGSNPENDKITFLKSQGTSQIVTQTDKTPYPSLSISPAMDLPLSFMLKHLSEDSQAAFTIDRSHPSCRTPRRNKQVEEALQAVEQTLQWSSDLSSFLKQQFSIPAGHALPLSSLNASGIFTPVLGLFERVSTADLKGSPGDLAISLGDPKPSEVLHVQDLYLFLHEHKRTLKEKISSLGDIFKDQSYLINHTAARLAVVVDNLKEIGSYLKFGVEYIEELIYEELVRAIGKEIGPEDYDNFLKHHLRVLFADGHLPRPFSYPIRRFNHHPEGYLSIEAIPGSGGVPSPVNTQVRYTCKGSPVRFPLGAAAEVTFLGERLVHGCLLQTFDGVSGTHLAINARAKPYSSYIVLIGRIQSVDRFDPTYAILVQNGDEITIPLSPESIPSAKQFREAVESLSPEQLRFAKGYRSMQLSSTLLGVVVLQVKPQLEKMLRLPAESLTKQIELTQKVLELLVDYHVPMDLLSVPKEYGALSEGLKMEIVKKNVSAFDSMVLYEKSLELLDRKLEKLLKETDERIMKLKTMREGAMKGVEYEQRDKRIPNERSLVANPSRERILGRRAPMRSQEEGKEKEELKLSVGKKGPEQKSLDDIMKDKEEERFAEETAAMVKESAVAMKEAAVTMKEAAVSMRQSVRVMRDKEQITRREERRMVVEAEQDYLDLRDDSQELRKKLLQMETKMAKMERRKSISMTQDIKSKMEAVEKQLQMLRKEQTNNHSEAIKTKIAQKMGLLEKQLQQLSSMEVVVVRDSETEAMQQHIEQLRKRVAEEERRFKEREQAVALRIGELEKRREKEEKEVEEEKLRMGKEMEMRAYEMEVRIQERIREEMGKVEEREMREYLEGMEEEGGKEEKPLLNPIMEESKEIDYSKLPQTLESSYDKIDPDGALRPTTLNVANTWSKTCYPSLLSPPSTSSLPPDALETEKQKALNLIDSLTNSGASSFDSASLHVLITATHTFQRSLMNTLVMDNVDPIDKMEKALLGMGSVVTGLTIKELVCTEQMERLINSTHIKEFIQ